MQSLQKSEEVAIEQTIVDNYFIPFKHFKCHISKLMQRYQ